MKKVIGNMSIEAARAGFEDSFEESNFYNKQTQDEKHLNNILNTINSKPGMKILDLGCGSGYLTFPIAKRNENAYVVGLDIVTNTLERNTEKAQEMDIKNLKFISYDGITFPFEDNSFDLVVTRYALHHFPEIRKSIHEVSRVLKSNGEFFISDAELLVEIYNASFYNDYIKYGECPAYGKTKEVMEKSIINYPKFLILCDGNPVGCISCKKIVERVYEVGCLCVIPEFQGKGIGTRAIEFVKSYYEDWDKFTLITPIDKSENIKFYTEKCGFNIVSTERDGNVEVARFVLER